VSKFPGRELGFGSDLVVVEPVELQLLSEQFPELRQRRPLLLPPDPLVLASAVVSVGHLEQDLPLSGVRPEEAPRVVDEKWGLRHRPRVGPWEDVVGGDRSAQPVIVQALGGKGGQAKVAAKGLKLKVEENDGAVSGSFCSRSMFQV